MIGRNKKIRELVPEIINLYENTTLTIQQIADSIGYSRKPVFNILRKNYTKNYRLLRKSGNYREAKLGDKNPMKGKYGELHHNFIGRALNGKGYYTVLKPKWYTGRAKSNRVFEHSVVYCIHNGLTEIPKGYLLHHIDINSLNNSIENLLLLTLSEHTKLHAKLRKEQRLKNRDQVVPEAGESVITDMI